MIDPAQTGWRKDIHAVAALLEKASGNSQSINRYAREITEHQKKIAQHDVEYRLVAKEIADKYPDLDMYFVQERAGLFYSGNRGGRYDILHATVKEGHFDLELIAEIGKEYEDEDDV
jgi:hypothetical protein